jgi:hypothetical protein
VLGLACSQGSADVVAALPSSVIYDHDDRLEVADAPPLFTQLARATAVALIAPEKLVPTTDGAYEIVAPTLQEALGVCPEEPFSQQVSAANCSGVLIAPDLVATSAHCVPASSVRGCGASRYVFGYHSPNEQTVMRVPARDVFDCVDVVAHVLSSPTDRCQWDLAVVRLDREVGAGRMPAVSRLTRSVVGEPAYVIGSPLGLPLKVRTCSTLAGRSEATISPSTATRTQSAAARASLTLRDDCWGSWFVAAKTSNW